jgi:hypothetical protein
MIDEKLCDEAIKRIARTADGKLLYLKLQKTMMGLPSDTQHGALRANHGRRSLAAELMAVMAEAMAETTSDGSGGSSGAGPDERPIIFQLSRAIVASPGQRGARRRVGPGTDPGSAE